MNNGIRVPVERVTKAPWKYLVGAHEIADRGWRESSFVYSGDTIVIANAGLRLEKRSRDAKEITRTE